ncbi:MAG: Parallel beta-helix repeat protein [Parcubacteria group bacterium GW2011_GWF2_50_9]|nr:MAG: Parallel beta-helix repeat protein [Parcubacteria group bacterium GW2011_GWF2_50_9]
MYNLKLKTVVMALAAFFLLFELMPDQAAAAICKNNIPCVNSNDIINGQVTTPDIVNDAVTGAKILDGSLTGADIQDGVVTGAKVATGTITGSNIAGGTITGSNIGAGTITGSNIAIGTITPDNIQPIAYRVVVATSGGDYTTISAALAAINPTATTPYVIEVMPGMFLDNVTMKSHVHLRGAGREVTTVQALNTDAPVLSVNSLSNVAISGLTIAGTTRNAGISVVGGAGTYGPVTITENTIIENLNGISNLAVSPVISGNLITGNAGSGIANDGSASIITGNIITNNGSYGTYSINSPSPTVKGNVITGNSCGVYAYTSSPMISENTITGNIMCGVQAEVSSSPTIIHNKITGNGPTDISVDSTSTPNISLNVYDTISGNSGIGQFNVNSSGGIAPVP